MAGHACAVHGYPVGHDGGVSSEPVVTGQTVDRIQLTAHPGWYFTGRSALLQELTGWLESGLPGRAVRVVTGPAWTGKSAVPTWLCTLSDPQLRAEIVGGRAGRRSSCPGARTAAQKTVLASDRLRQDTLLWRVPPSGALDDLRDARDLVLCDLGLSDLYPSSSTMIPKVP